VRQRRACQRLAFALGMTPEALAPLLGRMRDAGLVVIAADELQALVEAGERYVG
jgi:hypothetical protein